MRITDIENTLRRAPQPRPPANLEQRLRAQALNSPVVPRGNSVSTPHQFPWLARWWPLLPPTIVSLACAATFSVQQRDLHKLKGEAPTSPRVSASSAQGSTSVSHSRPGDLASPISGQDELTRLRAEAISLKTEIARLEQLQHENQQLRTQLAARSAGVFTPDEVQAMEDARDRALRIQCVNNLKQLGLAIRIWANDHGGIAPPDFLSMSGEIGSFKILVCPADSRQPAADAASFGPANCSYEYLAPLAPETEPDRIALRCPIHGSVCLIDGSVQSSFAKEHPDWIVQRDGKYYFQTQTAPPALQSPVPGQQ